ncbi:sarcospan isoform X2 [Piliocolobus tephrosceles]|uniref:sarcospan isoform X2 n=1 Tax=Piliocolobus tephrosceles TaxID=591936 RepID=UPI000C2A75F6|nr:sarcospan isoform X2 [Piliocolobus tephrosceles]XP_031792151.1 sarcospan isoform X2 [Piliocolobus tephrosceles]
MKKFWRAPSEQLLTRLLLQMAMTEETPCGVMAPKLTITLPQPLCFSGESQCCFYCLCMELVCLVAYLGLFMLCVSYQVDERTCIQFSMKLLYFLLSALGLTVCVLAVAFAAHHYSQLTQFTCETTLDSCQCKLPSSEPLSRTFVYRDVTDCTSVTGTFKLFLLIQMILNLVCGLVCLLACFVMWKHRYQVFYVGVRMRSLTASEGPQQKI